MIDVDWGQPFIDYIREQKVPTDKNLAQQLIHRAKSYVLVGDKLYKLWPVTCCSTTLVICCVSCGTSSSTVGAKLRLLSVSSPTVSQSSPSP
jgi:hypothetical protein